MKKAPNPIDRHVGSRVRMRRMLIGMSQEKLGESRPHLPAGPEIREGHEPDRRQPAAADRARARRAGPFFFEGAPGETANGAGFAEPASLALSSSTSSRRPKGSSSIKAFVRIKDPRSAAASSISSQRSRSMRGRLSEDRQRPVRLKSNESSGLTLDLRRRSPSSRTAAATRPLGAGFVRSGGPRRAPFELSVHQRIRVRGPSRQGLRPHLRRDRRPVLPRGREQGFDPGRCASPARPWPPPTASSSPASTAAPAPSRRRAHRPSSPRIARSRTSATSRTASTGRRPRSRCCCTPSRPTSPRASTPPATRTRAPATRASCSATPATRRRS